MRSRIAAVAGTACAVAAAAAPPASAYVVGGDPWPGATITYYAAGPYSASVARAARLWNRAGVGVRFRRTSRASADVMVVMGGRPCEGTTPMGYGGFRDPLTYVHLGAGCNTRLITLTAVHELGHVLGLDHEGRRCARMNPAFDLSGTPNHCTEHSLSYWLAHPLTADDIAGARALYEYS